MNITPQDIPNWPFIIIAACIGVLGAFAVQRFVARLNAAKKFRSSINPEAFNGIKGHILHGALIDSFPMLKDAVHEYRIHLWSFDCLRLDKAWNEYHGGDENHPELFQPYCTKDDGPETLKRRLDRLRTIGNKR